MYIPDIVQVDSESFYSLPINPDCDSPDRFRTRRIKDVENQKPLQITSPITKNTTNPKVNSISISSTTYSHSHNSHPRFLIALAPCLVFLFSLLLLISAISLLLLRNRKIARRHLGLEFSDGLALEADEISLLEEENDGNDDHNEREGYTKVEKITRKRNNSIVIYDPDDAVEKSGAMIEEEVKRIDLVAETSTPLSLQDERGMMLLDIDTSSSNAEFLQESSSRDAKERYSYSNTLMSPTVPFKGKEKAVR